VKIVVRLFFLVFGLAFKIYKRFIMILSRMRFNKCGKNVIFDPFSNFSYKNISIGDDVYIGPDAKFLTALSTIKIGNKVMFGPEVMLIGGNHNTSVIGSYMFDIKTKKPEDDLPIVIEEDVWVGARVTILKGVKISKGCIIAAGSIVNKTTEPYGIYAGAPAKRLRDRFEGDDLSCHLKILKDKKGI